MAVLGAIKLKHLICIVNNNGAHETVYGMFSFVKQPSPRFEKIRTLFDVITLMILLKNLMRYKEETS